MDTLSPPVDQHKVIRRNFKFRLYPNKEQTSKLQWTLARCCELYNAALQERKEAWKYERKFVTYLEQQNALPEIKEKIRPEYKDINSFVLQNVCRRVDWAMAAFYRRVKNGEKPGYPRYQSVRRYDSFTYGAVAGIHIKDRHVRLPKIGDVKITMERPIEGTIKTCTVKREIDQWYVVFSCVIEQPDALPLSYENVGIDLGVMKLATLSNGETIEHPRYYRKAQKKLDRLQQALSRKKRGSNRRKKAVKAVAKAHRKVRNQRRDFLHNESRKLVNRYQIIVFEDLQTANLTKRPKPKQDEDGKYLPNKASAKAGLNKSILDAGWYDFVQMSTYKAESAGRTLVQVNPSHTSQICSQCGTVVKKNLAERWHSCSCGCELDRDHNAAINILHAGVQLTG